MLGSGVVLLAVPQGLGHVHGHTCAPSLGLLPRGSSQCSGEIPLCCTAVCEAAAPVQELARVAPPGCVLNQRDPPGSGPFARSPAALSLQITRVVWRQVRRAVRPCGQERGGLRLPGQDGEARVAERWALRTAGSPAQRGLSRHRRLLLPVVSGCLLWLHAFLLLPLPFSLSLFFSHHTRSMGKFTV